MFLFYMTSNLTAQEHQNHDHEVEHKTNGDADNETIHEEHEGHDEHGDELVLMLSDEAVELAGIEISRVKYGQIGQALELPGEIGFNEDRLAHIAPRFAGVAVQANYRVGDYVEKGDVVAIVESNESMNTYSIRAPISGWVIDRHITQGEFVSEQSSIFIIADLSTVWVNLAVYPKDAARIHKGQSAIIKAVGSDNIASGEIEYVTPIIDFRTRSATARVVMPNPDNKWPPGTFVQARIESESVGDVLVVERSAVQYLDERSVVFVFDETGGFRPIDIVTGESDRYYTQVMNGLDEGIEYVSSGAFELKAKIVTSSLDPHAGHGH